MSRKRLEIINKTAEEIMQLVHRDEKYMIGVKILALAQVARGITPRIIEQTCGVSFKSVCNWVNAFNAQGIDGLKSKQKTGRQPRLSQTQLAGIKKTILEESPSDYGYNTAVWTGPLLIAHIREHYNVEYKKAQIYNILHLMGLSYQKGKGIYPESDADKRNQFISELKKTSG